MSVSNSALSGLRAATTDLQVTGNNVANSGTYGFKQSRAEFSDLFVSGVPGIQVGNGVQVTGISQEFTQVGFSVTGNPYDMAINGDNFFVLKGVNNSAPKFTRAGNFTVDRNGYITTQQGDRLQGFGSADGSITATVNDIQIPKDTVSPTPTDKIEVNLNLYSGDSAMTLPFDENDVKTYNTRASMEAFDSLGDSHVLNAYYVKTGDNTWDVHVEADGAIIGSGNIVFNTDGSLQSSAGLSALLWSPGNGAAANQAIDLDLSESTQYGSDTLVRNIKPNGNSSGNPVGVSIDKDGILSVAYSNGDIQTIGQVALASFDNPNGLFASGNTTWTETNDSGRPTINASNSIGALKSGALEDSNVDLTEQLVRLITAQRTFQANAQSIRAGDTLTQTIINIE